MRLWHQELLTKLPRQQLLGQHRECCALRGKGWGKKHSVVNYVFNYNPAYLVAYHQLVMNEMIRRGYNPNAVWKDYQWRGDVLGREDGWAHYDTIVDLISSGNIIYPEHNDKYMRECVDNLRLKGIEIK